MTPRQRIEAEYIARPEANSFAEDLRQIGERGSIVETDAYFIAGYPVRADVLLADKAHPFDCMGEGADCWYIAMMAGDCAAAWASLPYPLPLLGWHRDRAGKKELHVYPIARIRRLSVPQLNHITP